MHYPNACSTTIIIIAWDFEARREWLVRRTRRQLRSCSQPWCVRGTTGCVARKLYQTYGRLLYQRLGLYITDFSLQALHFSLLAPSFQAHCLYQYPQHNQISSGYPGIRHCSRDTLVTFKKHYISHLLLSWTRWEALYTSLMNILAFAFTTLVSMPLFSSL